MAPSKEPPAIGIYLGREYLCVGVWHHHRVEIIPNDQGNHTTPSYVAFTPDERLIGEAAKNQEDLNPTNTIFDMTRLLGRRFSDPVVQSDRKLWSFKVIQGAGDKPIIVVEYKGEERQLLPEELTAMVLEKMKEFAENFLKCSVQNAVITVPAYFNDSQRQAMKDAGEIAGLKIKRIVDEHIAAAVAYGFEKSTYVLEAKEKNVIVFDLGYTTVDVSIVNIKHGVYEVKATAGHTHFGGKVFVKCLLNHFLQEIKRKFNKDIADSPRTIRRLKSACERAIRILSFQSMTNVEVTSLYDGIDFCSNISRAQFEELNMDRLRMCMGLLTMCLMDARMKMTDIDSVVLVGESVQMFIVQMMLQEFFRGKEFCKGINPDEVVAYGAALQAAKVISDNGNDEILDLVTVTPFSLGIETQGGIMTTLIPRNTTIPTKREIDHNGILNLTKAKSDKIIIAEENGILTKEETQKMIEVAARFKAGHEEDNARSVGLNSLERLAYEIKSIARDPGVPTSTKRSLEDAADNVIAWLKTNCDAPVDEIGAQKRQLETIKGQIVYLGTIVS